MKIALPTAGHEVDSHFGHCEQFTIFTIDEKKVITGEENLVPPPGCGCKSELVPHLVERGVKVMLAGNMGEGARMILERHGISVVRGLSGDVRHVTEAWLQGKAEDSGLGCGGHNHHGCGHHHTPEHN
ncbi:MAG: NifB/NifX family molybdenum-iron cluster-binding protein [Candidatus Eremiobacteraeota bacterium]|nr:NifB/NifX family molybdenum-iron cluster-binding protein [Candidatus Eremiobacteraeota bacterium]